MVTKSQVPRGATRKKLCACGKFYYWDYLEKNKLRGSCSVCKISLEQKR